MPRHEGIQRTEWGFCERCGFEYPISMLVAQKGLRVCTKTCFDKTLVEDRTSMIAAVLADETEMLDQESSRIINDDGDLRFT